MSKIIIDNQSEIIGDYAAVSLVCQVMERGKVSNNGKQHCYCTTFKSDKGQENIVIGSWLNKKSERFVIYDEAF